MRCVTAAHPGCAASGLCREPSAAVGHCAGIVLGVDTNSGRGGVDNSGDQNRTGRSDAEGRITRLSGLCATRALSVDPGDLLRNLASEIRFGGGLGCIIFLSLHRCAAQQRQRHV